MEFGVEMSDKERLICQMANDALEQINLILAIKLEINSRGSDKSQRGLKND